MNFDGRKEIGTAATKESKPGRGKKGGMAALTAWHQSGFRFPAQPQEYKLVSLRECPVDTPLCDRSDLIADYWRKYVPTHPYFNADCECLVGIMLNARRQVKGHYLIAIGLVDELLVHPREVYRPAIVACASAVVLVHNHPTGDPTPSNGDKLATLKLIQAGRIIEIELLDHLIMGNGQYVSLRELGYFGEVAKKAA